MIHRWSQKSEPKKPRYRSRRSKNWFLVRVSQVHAPGYLVKATAGGESKHTQSIVLRASRENTWGRSRGDICLFRTALTSVV